MSSKHTAASGWVRVFLCATAVTLALAGACDKKEAGKSGAGAGAEQPIAPAKTTAADEPAAAADEPAAPKKVVGEELVQRITRCNARVESWDKEALKECFTDDADVRFLDSIPPSQAKGLGPVIVQYGIFRNAFRNFKIELPLILVNGTKSTVVTRVAGKHANATLGIPPTGKSISILQAEVADHDAQGRTAWIRAYDDQSTFFHQLGLLESASAAGAEKPWAKPIRQVAKSDETERANLEMVKRGLDAMAKGDIAGALSMYTPDAIFRYLPESKPYTGREEIEAYLRSYTSVSESLTLTVRDAWPAGEWVVAEITMKVKLARDLPGVEGSKGKGWELNSLELFRAAGGKVAEHWRFANGLKFAADLGLFDPTTLGAE